MVDLILELMTERIFLILLLMVVYVSLYFSVVTYFIRRKTQREKNFSKTLVQGLKTGSITTIDDVVNIYKGVTGLSTEDLSYRYSLSKRLREFLVDLVSKNKNAVGAALDDDTVRDWKQKLSEFIQKNEAISPYADLPNTERNILSDISISLEKNDVESVKRKTLELAGMIQARNDDLNKIRNINKWTVPLSAIGLALSIIFGILALIRQ